jgi:hypothetical protein
VQAALDELIDDLGTGAVGSSGATRVGIDAAAGAPNALPAGSVKGQLAQLLGFRSTRAMASFVQRSPSFGGRLEPRRKRPHSVSVSVRATIAICRCCRNSVRAMARSISLCDGRHAFRK